jgi:hypothetical protein
MEKLFELSKNTEKLLAITLYNDSGFWCGYVLDYNEDLVVIQHYTKYGKSDGIIVENVHNIESIEYDDDYCKSLEYLIHNHFELDYEEEVSLNIGLSEFWQLEVLKPHLLRKDRLIRVQINNDTILSGLLEKLDEETLELQLIGKEGQDDGKIMLKTGDIDAVRVNDLEGRKRLLLHNWKNGLID